MLSVSLCAKKLKMADNITDSLDHARQQCPSIRFGPTFIRVVGGADYIEVLVDPRTIEFRIRALSAVRGEFLHGCSRHAIFTVPEGRHRGVQASNTRYHTSSHMFRRAFA